MVPSSSKDFDSTDMFTFKRIPRYQAYYFYSLLKDQPLVLMIFRGVEVLFWTELKYLDFSLNDWKLPQKLRCKIDNGNQMWTGGASG